MRNDRRASSSGVVGVNLLWLVPGVVGGSEEYTVRLLRAFDRLDPDDIELKIYAQAALADAYPDLVSRFETIIAPRFLAGKAGRISAEATWLAATCRHDDLIHHAGSVVPLTSPRPFVFTVHDLQPLDLPENFSPVKRAWLGRMLPPSVKHAALVLCPSRFTADSVSDHFGLAEDRLRVIPHGHDRVEPGVLDPSVDRDLRQRYGRYFLFPGIAYPHKRHIDVIDALAILADEFPDTNVVFTGGPGPETTALDEYAASLDLGHRVHRLGRVPESELDQLYRSATALAFPSTYEGFGNPALEAMARGCPVVASNEASLPEVIGDAGLLVPAKSPAALADALRRVMTEPGLADALRKSGVERSAHFGWRPAGVALLDAYRVALATSDRHE